MNSHSNYRFIFNKYPDVVTIGQMCEMLGGIGIKTGYKLLKEGAIEGFKIGRRYMIPKINILKYLNILNSED